MFERELFASRACALNYHTADLLAPAGLSLPFHLTSGCTCLLPLLLKESSSAREHTYQPFHLSSFLRGSSSACTQAPGLYNLLPRPPKLNSLDR